VGRAYPRRASAASRVDHANVLRSIMDEHVSDSCLIDVSELDIGELLAQDRKSALARALTHVRASANDSAYSSFNANI
jgi:hypothetical protein